MKTISKNNQPLISVVMPVYNAEKYLAASINSILSQSYRDIEFIIVDDASFDSSYQIAKSYAQKDPRIKLFRNKKNKGISITAKRTMSVAKGEFIARMDADDIAMPERLEKQLSYLIKHPKTVAIGGQCLLIDQNGSIVGKKTFPTKFKDIYKYIFRFVPLQQPTLMINTGLLPDDFEFYRDGMNTAEEIELIFKLFMYGKVENLSDVLLMYRVHNGNTSFKNIKKTFFLTMISRIQAVIDYDYKPNLSGILVTLIQIVVILSLPEKVIFKLYALTRKTSLYHKISLLPTQKISFGRLRSAI